MVFDVLCGAVGGWMEGGEQILKEEAGTLKYVDKSAVIYFLMQPNP